MVAFTTATNYYSEEKLREEKHQPLSAKVWNSGIKAEQNLVQQYSPIEKGRYQHTGNGRGLKKFGSLRVPIS